MTSDDICPICKNPKTSSPGSLTQWIVACTCDAEPLEIEESEQIKVNICKTCGKRIGEGRSGSFTQFIFRSDTCQCERPVVDESSELFDLATQAQTNPDIAEEEVVYEDADEVALELEPKQFPVDRYKPLELLGSGATGSVYLARDLLLNKRVAVKILSKFNSKTLVAFQNEAKNTSQLVHPSIIDILDFGVTESESPFMVLEYFPGESLEEVLEANGKLDWQEAKAIIANICDAIYYANDRSFFHRDIKPSNILILDGNPENVRLIDFGIAAAKNTGKDEKDTPSSGMFGTPLYMSPEAGSGHPYDARSEVYSLCCVLYKAFVGEPPYEGKTVLETLTMHKESPRPQLDNPNNRQFLEEVNKLFLKGMAVDPKDRFQNAKELKEELESIKSSDITIDTNLSEIENEKAAQKPEKNKMVMQIVNLSISACIGFLACLIFVSPNIINKKPAPAVIEGVKEKSEIPHENILEKDLVDLGFLGKKWDLKGGALRGVEVKDEDFKELDLAPNVTILRINGGSLEFNGSGLKYINEHEFNKVDIVAIGFNDNGAKELSKFKGIEKLGIQQNRRLTIKGIEYLTRMKDLELFSLRFMNIPKGTAKLISRSKYIKFVELGHINNLTLDDIKTICTIPGLKALMIAEAPLGDEIIPIIMKKKLRQLSINGTKVTGSGLKKLEKMKSLKRLKISLDDGITLADYKRFKRNRRDCKVSADMGFSLGKEGMEEIKRLALPKRNK